MKNFKGVFTALITPFKNGKIDFQSLEKLVQYQIKNQTTGFVINGTTAGEKIRLTDASLSI